MDDIVKLDFLHLNDLADERNLRLIEAFAAWCRVDFFERCFLDFDEFDELRLRKFGFVFSCAQKVVQRLRNGVANWEQNKSQVINEWRQMVANRLLVLADAQCLWQHLAKDENDCCAQNDCQFFVD